MKVDYINSLSLPNGFRVKQYEESDIVALMKEPEKVTLITGIVNKYERQKDALVTARADLSELIATELKFPVKTITVKVDGKEVQEPDETDGEHIKRLIKSLIKGDTKHPSVTATNAEQREAEVYTLLQKLADKCGDRDENGKPKENPPCYVLDVSVAERAVRGPVKLPKYAIDGATTIIANGNQAKWIANLTKGYKASDGLQIPAMAFKPFDTKPAPGATPEDIEAVNKANIRNLATAIVAVEEYRRSQQSKKEYA